MHSLDDDSNFWKKASQLVDLFLSNPIKHNNEDLLENLPEDVSSYKELPSKQPVHLKSSSLDVSYRTYNPRVMTLIQSLLKLQKCSTKLRILRVFLIPKKNSMFLAEKLRFC